MQVTLKQTAEELILFGCIDAYCEVEVICEVDEEGNVEFEEAKLVQLHTLDVAGDDCSPLVFGFDLEEMKEEAQKEIDVWAIGEYWDDAAREEASEMDEWMRDEAADARRDSLRCDPPQGWDYV